MAGPPEYTSDGDDDLLEPFAISNEVQVELIKFTDQPDIPNVKLLTDTRKAVKTELVKVKEC